jgi:hypothetical protein
MIALKETPTCGAPFEVREEDGKYLVVSDEDEGFCMTLPRDSAYYACELLNRGYRMGYRAGEFRTQSSMRMALGLTV